MTPSARIQAAIEILDAVVASARDNGPPADVLVRDYFRTRRYAGSKDRRAVREFVFSAIRLLGERPDSGRAAMLALAKTRDLDERFDGSAHGPAPIDPDEPVAVPGKLPQWLAPEMSPLVDDLGALLERAPLDLRVHAIKGDRDTLEDELGAQKTPLSPWGLRLPPDSKIDDHPLYRSGVIEVQDEGSQLVALACAPENRETLLDLCAGAGGKSLALAAMAPGARIIASDVSRARLAQFVPRAERAGAEIEALLLNPPREEEALADLREACDLVLVDAPCSGSGTWRRNPEQRWRLDAERLDTLVRLQQRVLDLAADCVKPGGRLVYATCSVLTREGSGQFADFLSRHSDFVAEDALDAGRACGAGRLLTPGHDGTDGFFVARARRAC